MGPLLPHTIAATHNCRHTQLLLHTIAATHNCRHTRLLPHTGPLLHDFARDAVLVGREMIGLEGLGTTVEADHWNKGQ